MNEDEVRALHDAALAKIDEGDLEGAESIASELEGLRWSGAFEVRALARRKAGDLEGALAALDRGIELVPASWLFHQLRGNLLDELGRSSHALAAYDAALACGNVSVASVRYNRAITRLRAGDPGGALSDAEHVITEALEAPFGGAAVRVAVDALLALGRADDAVTLVEHVLARLDAPGALGVAAAGLHAARAKALLAASRSRDEVVAACERAIEGHAGDQEVADVLAAIAPDDPRATTRFRVVLEVPLETAALSAAARPPDDATGYYRTVGVVAASEDEARALAASLEPSSVRATAKVHEIAREAEVTPHRTHIAFVSGRIYFGD